MKYWIFCLFATVFIGPSCKTKTSPQTVPVVADSVKDYLPVADLIREDIRKVDSFAGGILRKGRMGEKKDSVFIPLARFDSISAAFLLPDLDSAYFHRHFAETSIMDETTQFMEFIYTPVDSLPSVRKLVVYITPDKLTNNVNRVYLEREYRKGDTLCRENMTWKMQKYYIIVSWKEPPGAGSSTRIQKVIWDPEDFADD